MRFVREKLASLKSIAMVFALWVVSGCGPAVTGPPAPKLYPVQGKVTFDKVPLVEGYITFIDPEKVMPSAGAAIKDGVFQLSVAGGQKRVEITGVKVVGVVDNPMMKTKDRKTEELLPAKFNTKSKLTAEISATKKNELTFDLTAE